jgi:hypothetical protein
MIAPQFPDDGLIPEITELSTDEVIPCAAHCQIGFKQISHRCVPGLVPRCWHWSSEFREVLPR